MAVTGGSKPPCYLLAFSKAALAGRKAGVPLPPLSKHVRMVPMQLKHPAEHGVGPQSRP